MRIRRNYRGSVGPRRQRQRRIGPRRQRRRRQQQGAGIQNNLQNNLTKGLDHGKKAANTEVGQMIVDDAISLIPKAYKKLKKKLFGKSKKTKNKL